MQAPTFFFEILVYIHRGATRVHEHDQGEIGKSMHYFCKFMVVELW